MSNRHNERRRHKRNLERALAKAREDSSIRSAHTNTIKRTSQTSLQRLQKLRERLRISGKYLRISVTGTIAVFGAMAAAYSLRPQMTVTAAPNENYRFTPILTVTNVGLTSIYDLTFNCGQNSKVIFDEAVKSTHATIKNAQTIEVGNNFKPESILRPQEPLTKTCAIETTMPHTHIDSAKVALRINFKPSFWPFTEHKLVQFGGRTDPQTGKVTWFSENPDPEWPREGPFQQPPIPQRH